MNNHKSRPSGLQAGFARQVITPPLGTMLEGFNLKAPAAAVHDELYARALYLADAGDEAVVLALDILFLERTLVDRMKGALGRTLELLPRQIFINCSHTHCGPRISHWHYSGAPDPLYLDFLEERLVQVVSDARAKLRPVTVAAGMTQTDIAINRRRINAQGKAEWGPYAAGPVCRALPIACLRDADDAVLALLFSASCHPTINRTSVFSAEYPGVAVEILNRRFSSDGAIFLQGAGGDTKPRQIAIGEEHFRDGTWDDVTVVGSELARTVVGCVENGLYPVVPKLKTSLVDCELPLAPAPPAAYFSELLTAEGAGESTRAWAADMLARLECRGRLPETAAVQVHCLELGAELRLVGVEGELGSELGLMIVRQFPRGVTFPLGYTNGSRLNIPCDRQLPEGGYGVDTSWEYHWPANLAPGIDQALRSSLEQL